MKYTFWIKYAMAGGYGGCLNAEWEEINVRCSAGIATAYQIAIEVAYEEAFELFESSQEHSRLLEELQEEGLEEDEITIALNDEADSWIDFEVAGTRPDDYEE